MSRRGPRGGRGWLEPRVIINGGPTTPIQLYGYANGSDADRPSRLSEVTVSASPNGLRRVAEFLVHAAELMEQRADEFGHEHLGDFDPALSADADLIVVVSIRDHPG